MRNLYDAFWLYSWDEFGQLMLAWGLITSDDNKPEGWCLSILHIAAKTNNFELFKKVLLTEKQCDNFNINAQDQMGWTALHLATAFGAKDIAELLVENGADITVNTYDGKTPVMQATRYLNIELTIYFLEKGLHLPSFEKIFYEKNTYIEFLNKLDKYFVIKQEQNPNSFHIEELLQEFQFEYFNLVHRFASEYEDEPIIEIKFVNHDFEPNEQFNDLISIGELYISSEDSD